MNKLTKVIVLSSAMIFAAPVFGAVLSQSTNQAISFLEPSQAEAKVKKRKKTKGLVSGFYYGALKCAINVNAYLRKYGKRTTNSAASASFLRFKRVKASQLRPFDLRYNRRNSNGGGHVAVYKGNGMCLNPRQNVGWRLVKCSSIWPGKSVVWVRP